jgi:hypothetical protein
MRQQTEQEKKAADDFNKHQGQILEALPEEFHAFVRTYAWEQGHSSGYNEVLNIEENLIYHLTRAIEKYTMKLQREIHLLKATMDNMNPSL